MEYDVNDTIWYGSKDSDDSDYCGDGCYWRIDGDTLIIGGRGTLVWAKRKYDYEYDYDYLTFPTSGYRKVIIEEGIESLAPCAFQGDHYEEQLIESIKLPNSLKEIGKEAFSSCYLLTSVVIPHGVTKIDCLAFDNCQSLTNVVIPNSVKIIEVAAFCGCISLKEIVIPESIEEIQYEAFAACNSLEKVIFNGTRNQWAKVKIGEDNKPLLNAKIKFVG